MQFNVKNKQEIQTSAKDALQNTVAMATPDPPPGGIGLKYVSGVPGGDIVTNLRKDAYTPLEFIRAVMYM